MYYKSCSVCGKEFETKDNRRTCCSVLCRREKQIKACVGWKLWRSPYGEVSQKLNRNGYFYVKDSKYPFVVSAHAGLRRANWVWWKVTGEDTSGFHVHHKDLVKTNDAFSNLEKLTPSQHGSDSGKYTPEVRKKMSDIRRLYKGAKRCAVCNSPYLAGATTGRYCSEVCRNAAKNAARRKGSYDRECPVCHTSFNTHQKQTYCSKDCKYQADNAKRNEKRRKEVGFKLITSHCEVCGLPYEHNINRPKKTCSKRCAFRAWYIKQK